MMKRIFDIIFSFVGILVFFIPALVIAISIIIDSKGGVFYSQIRVGKNAQLFNIYKFRTMSVASDIEGLLTVGSRDNRITRVGYFLRKYKLDELPQLINVFMGDMSIVGPRPEVPKYVEMYSKDQKHVLDVKPGISDLASIEYMDENDILAENDNPEKAYCEVIMPQKLKLSLKYIENQNFMYDMKIIIRTIAKIIRR